MVNAQNSMTQQFTDEELTAMIFALEMTKVNVVNRNGRRTPSQISIMIQEENERKNMRLYGNLFGYNGRSQEEDNVEEGIPPV